MITKTCPYCKIEFKTDRVTKIFCCYMHRIRYDQIMKYKETMKLNEHEKALYEEYHKGTEYNGEHYINR